MAKKVTFVFGLHNHQPVGNFDHVIEEAYSKAYLPFIEVMSEFPDIPFALHNSGILWDWFRDRHPEYLEILKPVIERSQVELLSAGYFEPILTVIPERDRIGQLTMMSNFLGDEMGCGPRGCWLTERIWEPHLPGTLSRAGIDFVIVDDSHFKSIGFPQEKIRGYFETEEDGLYVSVFPIDKKLRYLVPFSEPEEAIAYLRSVRDTGPDGAIVVLADDGEKFGVWPGTHELCYRKGWLKRFLKVLSENRDWLDIKTFSQVLDSFPPRGIVYIPTASYSEMMEWALPLAAQRKHREAKEALRSDGRFAEPAEMVRGGFWRNFLIKYEESNWMHKRMLGVSGLLEEYRKENGEDETWKEARNNLYQAQCNCAYWHGLFGGLYLPHLRSAVFRHIIEAETLLEKPSLMQKTMTERLDIDGDGVEEIILTSEHLKLIFRSEGAALREFDIHDPPFNLTDILRRRKEIYHDKVAATAIDADPEPVSIHEINAAKEKGLDRRLIYDSYQRMSLLEHFVESGTGIDEFSGSSFQDGNGLSKVIFDHRLSKDGKRSQLIFDGGGKVRLGGSEAKIMMRKTIRVDNASPSFEAEYTIKAVSGAVKGSFVVENVFSLLAGDAPDRYFLFPGRKLRKSNLSSSGEERGVDSLSIIDEWLNIEVGIGLSPSADIWRFPIETVSNSESGFESVYQGSVIASVWPIKIERGVERVYRLSFEVKKIRK